MDKGHNFNNFIKIGWPNEMLMQTETHAYVD